MINKNSKQYLSNVILSLSLILACVHSGIAQEKTNKISDLIHTKLDVRFDYKKRYLYGKEWVTIRPHATPSDSLRLDAKGMEIKSIEIVKSGKNLPLKYTYDQQSLAIKLDRKYKNTENYTLYINYISKPNELKFKAGKVITDNKGLFFINPDSATKGKPIQIWTQSALENASVWFPTIDKPDQKTTGEISITVPSKYTTLSNGRLVSQIKNSGGTRTDLWKMDLPHSPYLFMMAVGNFRIFKDKWRNKEVNYYLEPKYAPYAKDIFGLTPEMMEFFSKSLGVDFPWNKYSQVVVRDFVSGGMENTSASVYISNVQATARELADRNYDLGRSIIAHELFHQWFGNYVTTMDWANTTVNESFADFGETLWAEHKYGQDTGDDHNNVALLEYLNDTESAKKDLVRLKYDDPQDVFDVVSYQKGGRVLNMLRNYLSSSVFFKGLNIYLKSNAFKNGDANKLRNAMEQASGKDLGWFFEQWYYGAGHPLLDISYQWDEVTKNASVFIKQTQDGKAFTLPMAIDIYLNGKMERQQVWAKSKNEKLTFKLKAKPDLINVDGDKIILTKKKDHKMMKEFLYQYKYAPLYLDRYEAIEAASNDQKDTLAQKILLAGLSDTYYGLQLKTINSIDRSNNLMVKASLPLIIRLAESDKNNSVKAGAITMLSETDAADQYYNLYKNGLKNSSYAVNAASLIALSKFNPDVALKYAQSVEKDLGGDLTEAVISIYAKYGSESQWDFVNTNFNEADPQKQFSILKDFAAMTARMKNIDYTQQGINSLKNLAMNTRRFGTAPEMIGELNAIKLARHQLNDSNSVVLIDKAIEEINSQ